MMNQTLAEEMLGDYGRRIKSFAEWFVLSAGAILAFTGIGKIWSGLGSSKLLAVVDPIIGIKFGQLMLTVGAAEIAVALVCFFSKRQTLALGLVAWMSTNFVVYRLGLWWMDWHRPCGCLGNLTDALHISSQADDNIMQVTLAYPQHGSSPPNCDRSKIPIHCFRRAARPRHVATAIGRVSILGVSFPILTTESFPKQRQNLLCKVWCSCELPLLILLAVSVLGLPHAGHSQQFMGEGHVVYRIEREKARRTNEVTLRFVVLRDGDRWKIRTFDEKSRECATCTNNVNLFWEAGYDGTNIFYLEQQDLKKLKKAVEPKTFNADNFISAMARVEADQVPRMEMNLINFVWQAYASARYYSSLTNNKAVSPLFVLENVSPLVQLPAQWTDAADTHFVSEVIWFSDGTYQVMGPKNKLEVKKYYSPYSDGFVQARFQNLTWTNFDNLSVPSGFALSVYVPAGVSNAAPNFNVAYHITGFLETIEKVKSFSVFPELTSRTLVKDFRYAQNGEPVGYATASRWYASDEEMRRYLTSIGSATKVPIGRDSHRVWVLTILASITVGGALLIFLSRNKQNTNRNITTKDKE